MVHPLPPTPAQIRTRAAEIQSGWSERVRRTRQGNPERFCNWSRRVINFLDAPQGRRVIKTERGAV